MSWAISAADLPRQVSWIQGVNTNYIKSLAHQLDSFPKQTGSTAGYTMDDVTSGVNGKLREFHRQRIDQVQQHQQQQQVQVSTPPETPRSDDNSPVESDIEDFATDTTDDRVHQEEELSATTTVTANTATTTTSSPAIIVTSKAELEDMTKEALVDRVGNLEKKQQTDTEKERNSCIICLSAKRSHVLIPCGHYNLCENCVVQVAHGDQLQKKCPVCRQVVEKAVKVYQ